jgi:hypothetical protein
MNGWLGLSFASFAKLRWRLNKLYLFNRQLPARVISSLFKLTESWETELYRYRRGLRKNSPLGGEIFFPRQDTGS